ncbi:MAG TPA: methyltransferase domain-containing protein [Candidatus Saccharimonadales bacterium]|nr:methyltransferase domain-containing protein [Candidatus Saccharimonadales bacterium]
MQSLLILGRQPALGLAELESLYGAAKVRPVGEKVAVVDVDPCLLAFDRLGGALKFCKILTTLETTAWKDVEKFLVQVSPGHSERMPEGKMQLGLSAIGLNVDIKQLGATALTLKKAIKKTGRNVRVIPNKALELNTAQVLHNGLTKDTGWELNFIRDGDKTIIAQTVKVQDIESYTRRDRGRPKRDTRVGMLPPKLAQIIINLAVGALPEEAKQSICEIPPDEPIPPQHFDLKILDPFCGTGVLLQEAYLMGYGVYGTDLERRMVDYTRQNMNWLVENFNPGGTASRFETADATSYQWPHEFDIVASETYLGRPLTALPDPESLARNIADCNLIIKKFLQNIRGQVQPGTRFCLAVPAWQTKRGQFKFLPLVDQIDDLGYNRVSFEHLGNEDLLYYRSDQLVARQLLVITRK